MGQRLPELARMVSRVMYRARPWQLEDHEGFACWEALVALSHYEAFRIMTLPAGGGAIFPAKRVIRAFGGWPGAPHGGAIGDAGPAAMFRTRDPGRPSR